MFEQALATIPPIITLLWGLALVISGVGFYRTVYFISIGYAFSITAMVVTVVLALRTNLSLVTLLQNLALLIWSLRLGLFLVQRELQESYRRQVARTTARANALPLKAKFFIWISVSLLYVAMFSPALFSLTPVHPTPTGFAALLPPLGVLVMFGGIAIEALADAQKSAFKRHSPSHFCDVQLYRLVRCPNYLGEILFWIGNWMVGLAHYNGLLQWIISLVGLVCIILIMIGSTKRLEKTQAERYGNLPDYQTYIRTVPVLVPFVPVYTLANVRVYLE